MDKTGGYQDYDFIADLYDHVTTYGSRGDVEFFVDEAKRSGGPVLELGCGTGRVLIPTARAGIEIVGLDLSEHMLDTCRRKLADEPAKVRSKATVVSGDMRHFALGQKFNLVTIPFRPFQHLTSVDDQLSCLRSVHSSLNPGGRFILDLFNPKLEALTADNLGQEVDENIEFSLPDGSVVTRKYRIASRDHFKQIVQSELIYYVVRPDGREERLVHAFPMRYLFRYEVEHLLARSEFEIESLYAGYDKSPFGSKYPGELIFVARKLS
jgi:SAM-dependent methyltransferase